MSFKQKYKKLECHKYELSSMYGHRIYFLTSGDIECGKISIDANCIMWIEPGYIWDGPSGPTRDTDNAMRGSLVHDALYDLMRAGEILRSYRNRKSADKLFYRILRADGMGVFRARAWYIAVRMFGTITVRRKS